MNNLNETLRDFSQYLADAVAHYERSAPSVAAYLDDLYIRIGNNPATVVLTELTTAAALQEDGHWEQPNYAANRVYKLLHSLGRDTTGLAGF